MTQKYKWIRREEEKKNKEKKIITEKSKNQIKMIKVGCKNWQIWGFCLMLRQNITSNKRCLNWRTQRKIMRKRTTIGISTHDFKRDQIWVVLKTIGFQFLKQIKKVHPIECLLNWIAQAKMLNYSWNNSRFPKRILFIDYRHFSRAILTSQAMIRTFSYSRTKMMARFARKRAYFSKMKHLM